MIRRPPRSTLDRSSAASDVYKRQLLFVALAAVVSLVPVPFVSWSAGSTVNLFEPDNGPVSYTHLRAHETVLDLVCRLLLEKNNKKLHYDTTVSDETNNKHSDINADSQYE